MATIVGTAGDDSLLGTGGADSISGLEGNDSLDGAAGSDTLDGGLGRDILYWDQDAGSSGGHDVYHGGTGGEDFDPNPYSHNGGDTLSLGDGGFNVTYTSASSGTAADAHGNTLEFDGTERSFFGAGGDSIDASGAVTQDDVGVRLYTGAGNDTVIGSSATDFVRLGDGDDLFHGGDGNDVAEGGAGNDTLYGEGGNDGYRWGDGNYDGQIGTDYYYGGSGYNTLNAWQNASDGSGTHVVLDSSDSGTVTAAGQGVLHYQEFQNLLTGGGNDTIDASGAGVNGFRVYANWGDDSIIGSHGNDEIEGGYGADTIDAGAGNDWVSMTSDLFRGGEAEKDTEVDTLVLRDGFGQDTVRAFSITAGQDQWGNAVPADRLDVSNLHDADGNPLRLSDVTVGSFTDNQGTHA